MANDAICEKMMIGDEFKVLGVVGWAFTSKYPNSLLFSVKVPAFAD